MGTRYTATSITSYNSAAPPDDGSTGSDNIVTWAGVKTKLGDPIKTALESIDTKLTAFVSVGPSAKSANYTTVAGDHLKTIECTNTITITLLDAATATAGYTVGVFNAGSGTVTIGRVTGADTINGAAGDITVAPNNGVTLRVIAAATGYVTIDSALRDIAGLAKTDGNVIVGDGTNWVAESGATVRTSLGLGTAAEKNTGTSGTTVPLLDGVNTWSGAQTFSTDIAVADGGTGASTAAAARANLGVIGTGLQQEGLIVTNGATTATQVDVDADSLIVYNTSGDPVLLTSVNATATITTSGANGLDTGVEASGTWYHVWVIYDGSTTAALLSTSSTAPTMPSGYTYKQRVGAVRNNASSNFLLFRQLGRTVRYEEQVTIKNGSFGTSGWTAQDVTAFYPPTAKSVIAAIGTATGNGWGSLSHRSDGFGGSYVKFNGDNNSSTLGVFPTARFNFGMHSLLYAATLYYQVTSADTTLLATGWEF